MERGRWETITFRASSGKAGDNFKRLPLITLVEQGCQ